MPIFEYVCQQCGARFEKLILSSQRSKSLRCPQCGTENVEKAISLFSSGVGSANASGSAATSSAGSSCGKSG